jgi:hypothetical protein
MAIQHYCYSFKRDVLRSVYSDSPDELSVRIHEHALAALGKSSATIHEALVAIRFSDTWLEDEQESDRPAKELLVYLLANSLKISSLGCAGEPPYHVIITALLKDIGWHEERISKLIRGRPLNTLLENDGPDELKQVVAATEDFAGFLSFSDCAALIADLNVHRDYFFDDSLQHKQILSQITAKWAPHASTLARAAWLRSIDMLESCAEQEALLLVLD